MPTVRHAHLLLPSALGLLEYDVLEDAVFLGAGPRGLQARPSPFKEAQIALMRGPEGYVARPLPGETAPEINGQTMNEAPLADGDRIKIGEHVVLFRTDRGPVRPPPAAVSPEAVSPGAVPAGAGPRRGGGRRKTSSKATTILGLVGAALVLIAAVRAVSHLSTLKDQKRKSETGMPESPQVSVRQPTRAGRDLAKMRVFETNSPTRFGDIAKRYRGFIDHHQGAEEVDVAQARLREIMDAWAARERGSLQVTLDTVLGARQFARATSLVREFEERFGSTRAGGGLGEIKERIATEARTALDETKGSAAILIEKNPRQALRLLRTVAPTLPPNMIPELADLIDEARAAVAKEESWPRRAGTARPKPPKPVGNGGPERPPPLDPGHRGETPEGHAEQIAKQAWSGAYTDLVAGRYKQAQAGYTLLAQRYSTTALYKKHRKEIELGMQAARAGTDGPASILEGQAEMRRGRLEVEYTFDRYQELDDFSKEQPFATDKSVDVKHERGAVSLAGASGFMHKLVYLADVRIEVNATADVAHDFGLIALEESDSYRAVIFSINNTRFTLKKGDNARPNPGHLLWYVGQGVWKDADADAHGYIKIGERTVSKLKDGDKVKMDLTRKDDACEVSFGARTDGVHLQGKVKGDDGSTMGPAKVGVFANTGIVRIHQIKISGVVDPAWWAEHVKWMVSVVSGPE